jgi:hypothetical protein
VATVADASGGVYTLILARVSYKRAIIPREVLS